MRNLEIKNETGRSMIEMLGVLAIIGVLSVGGIAGYSKAMMKYRINKTIEQITLIVGNIQAFWGPQKNYDGVDCLCDSATCFGHEGNTVGCPIIKKAKILPDEMVTLDSTGNVTKMRGDFGDIYIQNMDNYKSFVLGLLNIPQEVCIELMTHDWAPTGITLVGIFTVGDMYLRVPINVDKAIDICPENPVEMLFVYGANLKSEYWNGLILE